MGEKVFIAIGFTKNRIRSVLKQVQEQFGYEEYDYTFDAEKVKITNKSMERIANAIGGGG